MIASVIALEERKTTYRTPEGEERPTFTGTPNWLYAYMPKLKQGCGWELLSLILHHQRMGLRLAPVAISLTQFQRETGRAIRTIQKGLSDLARVGLLYEELESPGRQESAIRYAIVSQQQVGQTLTEQVNGHLVVHLLDGLYDVDPIRVITRKGVEDSHTSSQRAQNEERVGETQTRGVRNFTNWASVSKTPPAANPFPEAVPSIALDKRDKKDNVESTPPYGGAAQRIIDENISRVSERSERSSLIPLPHAATALEHPPEELAAEKYHPFALSEPQNPAEPLGSDVGAAPGAPDNKQTLFSGKSPGTPSDPAAPVRARKNARRTRASSRSKTDAEAPEARAALEARTAALVSAWLAHPATVQPGQMSETERRRFYSGIAKLARSSLTLEEVPALLDAQARWSRGTYTPDPHTLEASLGTLRREAATWTQPGNTRQKGTTHVGRHTGSWSGQHGRDDELVIKC
jgi:hypothetical protein